MSDAPKETKAQQSLRREMELRAKLRRLERENRRSKNPAWKPWMRARNALEAIVELARASGQSETVEVLDDMISEIEAAVDLMGPQSATTEPTKEENANGDEEVRPEG